MWIPHENARKVVARVIDVSKRAVTYEFVAYPDVGSLSVGVQVLGISGVRVGTMLELDFDQPQNEANHRPGEIWISIGSAFKSAKLLTL